MAKYQVTASFWAEGEDSDSVERGVAYALRNISGPELEFDGILEVTPEGSRACEECGELIPETAVSVCNSHHAASCSAFEAEED